MLTGLNADQAARAISERAYRANSRTHAHTPTHAHHLLGPSATLALLPMGIERGWARSRTWRACHSSYGSFALAIHSQKKNICQQYYENTVLLGFFHPQGMLCTVSIEASQLHPFGFCSLQRRLMNPSPAKIFHIQIWSPILVSCPLIPSVCGVICLVFAHQPICHSAHTKVNNNNRLVSRA